MYVSCQEVQTFLFLCFASLKQAVGNLFLDLTLHTIISRLVIASLFKIVHNKIAWAIVDDWYRPYVTERDCPFALMCYTAGVKWIQLVHFKGYVENTEQCKNARDDKDNKHCKEHSRISIWVFIGNLSPDILCRFYEEVLKTVKKI